CMRRTKKVIYRVYERWPFDCGTNINANVVECNYCRYCLYLSHFASFPRNEMNPGVSFQLDCYNHAIFAVRQWPRRTFPRTITALTGMGFQEYAITMNVYPKRVDRVIEREEQHIQRLQIDALTERKQSLVTDLAAKQEK